MRKLFFRSDYKQPLFFCCRVLLIGFFWEKGIFDPIKPGYKLKAEKVWVAVAVALQLLSTLAVNKNKIGALLVLAS